MDLKFFDIALDMALAPELVKDAVNFNNLKPAGIKKVKDRPYSYTQRHRGQWFTPEYRFEEIGIVQDVDSYLLRSLLKKTNRFLVAGYEFTSLNDDALRYIKQRIAEMEIATQKPFLLMLVYTFADLGRFNNAMWAKTRDIKRSSGKKRIDIRGVELDPVAGYHIIPFETLQFKTRPNGEIKKVMQKMEDGVKKEFFPADIVHFFSNRKPGFSVGTPELFPALDDIALLRRIEENVEELIETNLFPVYHYKVGTDDHPARYGPDGVKEEDVVKRTIEYMQAGAVYVSDHRHTIEAIGSESKALRIDAYLEYFKKRMFAAIGTTSVDMGEGDTATRSTANTLSKSVILDVEAIQATLKMFIEFEVINELLIEGGFNPIDEDDRVHIKFGIIDKEARMALENNQLQMFVQKGITLTEFRANLGIRPMTEEQFDDTYYKLFEEPLAMVKGMVPGSAAGETLAAAPTSNVSTEAVNKERAFAEKQAKEASKAKAAQGRPANSSSTGSSRSSASRSRPSNQHGTRSAPKLNRDVSLTVAGENCTITVDCIPDAEILSDWEQLVASRYQAVSEYGVSLQTVIDNQIPRLYRMCEEIDNE